MVVIVCGRWLRIAKRRERVWRREYWLVRWGVGLAEDGIFSACVDRYLCRLVHLILYLWFRSWGLLFGLWGDKARLIIMQLREARKLSLAVADSWESRSMLSVQFSSVRRCFVWCCLPGQKSRWQISGHDVLSSASHFLGAHCYKNSWLHQNTENLRLCFSWCGHYCIGRSVSLSGAIFNFQTNAGDQWFFLFFISLGNDVVL